MGPREFLIQRFALCITMWHCHHVHPLMATVSLRPGHNCLCTTNYLARALLSTQGLDGELPRTPLQAFARRGSRGQLSVPDCLRVGIAFTCWWLPPACVLSLELRGEFLASDIDEPLLLPWCRKYASMPGAARQVPCMLPAWCTKLSQPSPAMNAPGL